MLGDLKTKCICDLESYKGTKKYVQSLKRGAFNLWGYALKHLDILRLQQHTYPEYLLQALDPYAHLRSGLVV